VADRLRDLIDLVLASLDDPDAGGAELARRASFSRDHLDRLLSAATGETPVALRRRLLLERAAWRLRDGASASEAAEGAGYRSLAAFSRAFARAHGVPPSAFAASGRPTAIEAPNGVHFLAPAGLLVPRQGRGDVVSGRVPGPSVPAPRDLTERMVLHHLARSRELLEVAGTLPVSALRTPLRPAPKLVWFEGPEPDAATMAERLVRTLEVWVAAVLGELPPEIGPSPGVDRSTGVGDAVGLGAAVGTKDAVGPGGAVPADGGGPGGGSPDPPHPSPGLLDRLDRAGPAFAAIARRVRDGEAWDDAFVDALCDPPQAFTYGGVLSHVLTYGAVRREALAAALTDLGATVPSSGDPIAWEASR